MTETTWTEDDYSEFAEALAAACEERIAKGWSIVPPYYQAQRPDKCCPVGAFIGGRPFPTRTVWR